MTTSKLPVDFFKGVVKHGNVKTDPTTLTGVLTAGLVKHEDRHRKGRLYASQTGFCTRQAVIGALVPERERVEAASSIYFKMGIAIEEMALEAFKDQRILLFSQYRLPDVGLNLGGYVDGIVYLNGRLHVVEIKSCGELPKAPKPDHKAQAMIYSAITGLPPIVLYVSRAVADFHGNLKIAEFTFTPGRDELVKTVFNAAYARAAVMMERLPRIPFQFAGPKDCGFCHFKHVCWENEPVDLPNISPEDHLALVRQATEMTETIMHPERVARRRNGVLNYIKMNGGDDAKRILSANWNDLWSNED